MFYRQADRANPIHRFLKENISQAMQMVKTSQV